MTSDGDALFRAICEQPREDTPRLVYADWLQENGDPERAEFIRFQCEFPKWGSSHPRFRELVQRTDSFEPHFSRWMSPLPRVNGIKWWDTWWERGFIDSVTFASTKAFVENADAVFAASPVRLLEVRRVTRGTIGRVLRSGYLKRVDQLMMIGSYGTDGAQAISLCANLVNLESLCVWGGCTDDGAALLATSPFLGRLSCLSFSGHTLSDRGVDALIDSDPLRSVTRLVLHGTDRFGRHTRRRLKERFGTVE